MSSPNFDINSMSFTPSPYRMTPSSPSPSPSPPTTITITTPTPPTLPGPPPPLLRIPGVPDHYYAALPLSNDTPPQKTINDIPPSPGYPDSDSGSQQPKLREGWLKPGWEGDSRLDSLRNRRLDKLNNVLFGDDMDWETTPPPPPPPTRSPRRVGEEYEPPRTGLIIDEFADMDVESLIWARDSKGHGLLLINHDYFKDFEPPILALFDHRQLRLLGTDEGATSKEIYRILKSHLRREVAGEGTRILDLAMGILRGWVRDLPRLVCEDVFEEVLARREKGEREFREVRVDGSWTDTGIRMQDMPWGPHSSDHLCFCYWCERVEMYEPYGSEIPMHEETRWCYCRVCRSTRVTRRFRELNRKVVEALRRKKRLEKERLEGGLVKEEMWVQAAKTERKVPLPNRAAVVADAGVGSSQWGGRVNVNVPTIAVDNVDTAADIHQTKREEAVSDSNTNPGAEEKQKFADSQSQVGLDVPPRRSVSISC